MTNPPNNSGYPAAPRRVSPDDPASSIDVADISAALDRLAILDERAAQPALEGRIIAASLRALTPLPRDIAPIGAQVDTLAAHAQLSASAELEDRAFELSREAVASGRFADPVSVRDSATPSPPPSLRLTHAPDAPPRAVIRHWSSRPSLRMAAAIALIGAAAAALFMSRSTTTPPTTLAANPTAEEIAANISTEMDLLFANIDSDSTGAMTDSADSDSDFDTSWVDDLFTRESL